MTTRYEQMLPLIDQIKPSMIVEVGVHRARRAVMLCERALRHSKVVKYHGFDVFETMSLDFQKEAMNGKGMPTKKEAIRALDSLLVSHKPTRFFWDLTVGDTRQTLRDPFPAMVDFAFIDGDHRLDAIRGDYAALRHARCVVFDDYYVPERGKLMPIDLNRYGCNILVDELIAEGVMNVKILPQADTCNHGGMIKLAVVTK